MKRRKKSEDSICLVTCNRIPRLCCRIDAVDRGTELVLMEVELIERQLFFSLHEKAASN